MTPMFKLTEKFDRGMMRNLIDCPEVSVADRKKLVETFHAFPSGSYQVTYDMETEYGRMRAKSEAACLPFVQMWREQRNILASSLYWDIDMVNCHPRFALQFAQKHGLPCSAITDYVENRDKHLEEMAASTKVPKKDVKQLFISIIYGASVTKWWKEHGLEHLSIPSFLTNYGRQVRGIMDKICEDRPEFLAQAKRLKEEGKDISDDLKASATCSFFMDIERRCVTAIVKKAMEEGYTIGSIIYDGFLIEKSGVQVPSTAMLRAWEAVAAEETGYKVELIMKPMELCEKLLNAREERISPELDGIIKRLCEGITIHLRDLVMYFAADRIVSVNKLFYYFDGVRWRQDPEAAHLHVIIADEICPILERLSDFYSIKAYDVQCRINAFARSEVGVNLDSKKPSEATKEFKQKHDNLFLTMHHFAELRSKVNKACTALGMVRKRNDVVTEFAKKSTTMNHRFEQKLDANPFLLAFDDCVFDFKLGRVRPARKDDYITMSTGYAWCDEDDFEIQEYIMKSLRACFTDEETVEHFLLILAYTLCGDKFLEELWMLTGNGRNGKTLYLALMAAVLGIATDGVRGYAAKPPTTFFTAKEAGSSAPTADKMMFKGARMILLSEPRDALNIPLLKEISGRDLITGRSPYAKTMDSFMPQCSIFMLTNTVPKMPGADDAFMRRFNVINFPNTFVPKEEVKYSFHREMKTDIKIKFGEVEFAQQFARILTKVYVESGVGCGRWNRPASVMNASIEVMRNNDPVRAFLGFMMERDMLVRCEEKEGKVRVDVLKDAFDEYMTRMDGVSYEPWQRRTFLNKMVNNSFKVQTSHKVPIYKGLRLNDGWEAVMSSVFDGDDDE